MNGVAAAVVANGQLWRRARTGNVQHYALVFLGGAIVLPLVLPGAVARCRPATVLLSLIIWTPLIGALLVLLVPRDQPDGARRAALAFSLVTFAAVARAVGRLPSPRPRDFQFVEQMPWVPSFGI